MDQTNRIIILNYVILYDILIELFDKEKERGKEMKKNR